MKVILDTNVLINVLLGPSRRSASYRVVELCLSGQVQPQLGAALFAEYEDVANREHVCNMSLYSHEEIEQFLDGFFSICQWVKINYLWRPNLLDEADNHLIELAVASNARFIVTQNVKDMRSGDLKFDFEVLTPDEFLKKVT